MAQRRMFSLKITDTDSFLDMPLSAQAFYFHLNMHADDDGFIANVKTLMRMVKANDDDLKLLVAKQFILPFDNGVVVIKDWRVHNYIQKDRYNPTVYTDEKAQLDVDSKGSYTKCIQDVSKTETQVRLGKDRLGKSKDRLNKPLRKRRKRVYQDEDTEYQLASHLFNKIKNNNPEAKMPNLQQWSDTVRLMIERDQRKPQQIKAVIDWCQADPFWLTNILSPAKLRKQYDRLKIKMDQETPYQSNLPPDTPEIPMYNWAEE